MRLFSTPVLLLSTIVTLGCGSRGGDNPPGDGSDVASVTLPVLPPGAQAVSFLGEPLYPPEGTEEVRAAQRAQLDEALAGLEADPDDAEALIWVGRRQAYLGDYRRAIETFTGGIELHPDDARFYRHRGHRYITVRELDRAVADFRRAAELIQGTEDQVEPDGQPNVMGIPTSTLHFNIWYHYGLALYLKGEFAQAADIYGRCMEASVHADSKIATAHWWYMSLRRASQEDAAREVLQGLELDALAGEMIESGSYMELLRLYAAEGGGGEAPDPESLEGATQGYGLGNWKLYNGDSEGATETFRTIVGAQGQWGAFGYIAAEADLARLGG